MCKHQSVNELHFGYFAISGYEEICTFVKNGDLHEIVINVIFKTYYDDPTKNAYFP